jgi:hypothetical protein
VLNTLTITPEEARDARAKAFYLLEKWTSLPFLSHAVDQYRKFLHAYAKQLETPNPNQKELELAYLYDFLPALAKMDEAIEALRAGSDKRAAYERLLTASARSSDLLFGRSANETGRTYDPFFQALGVLDTNYTDAVYATGFAEGVWIEELSCQALQCTAGLDFIGFLTHGKRADGQTRLFRHWTYESMFQDALYPAWRLWPPGREYPADLPSCPPKNESSDGEIRSGQPIPVEGIWEPWFPSGEVGCPNYFLESSVAHRYLLEGSNDEYEVHWRLLWEDKRYRVD